MGVAPAHAHDPALPDPAATPGALNPAVTQATIGDTICRRGWTRTVRPPERFTEDLKRRQLHDPASPYYAPDARLRDVEEDHLVPLGVGGAPNDPRNLWPEPRRGRWNAAVKDRLEALMARLVCERRVTLAEGRAAFTGDWIAAYRRYLGEP